MLYRLTKESKALYDLLSEEIENPEEMETILKNTLEAMDADNKVEWCCEVLRSLESDSLAFKTEKDYFSNKQKQAENGVKRLKEELLNFLKSINEKEVKTGKFTVKKSISKSVEITDDKLIAKDFLVAQEPKIDKAKIREFLLKGEKVNGAFLKENENVRIK